METAIMTMPRGPSHKPLGQMPGRLASLIGKKQSGCSHAVAKSYNDYVVYETFRGQQYISQCITKHSQRPCTGIT